MIPIKNELVHELILFCRINPLERPRKSGHRIYQPKENQSDLYDEAYNYRLDTPVNYPVIVDTEIYFKKPPKCKAQFPTNPQFGDEDNLRKSILDAISYTRNKKWGILKDDRLVLGGCNLKAFGDENYAKVRIYTVG